MPKIKEKVINNLLGQFTTARDCHRLFTQNNIIGLIQTLKCGCVSILKKKKIIFFHGVFYIDL